MKIKNFFKKRIFLIAFLVIGASFIFSVKTEAASYNFQPSNPVLDAECVATMDLYVDVTGEDSNAADLEIFYNTSQITVLDTDPGLPGVQIIPGNAYETFFANEVNTGTGLIRIAAASFTSTHTSNALFATIQFTSNVGVTSTSFNINFTGVGDTLDSNIAETTTANDLLTSVTNGNPTFQTSACSTNLDNAPPAINFISPVNGQTNVSISSPITFSVTDDYSGADITTLSMSINGNVYNYGSPYISVTGTPTNYTITFNPPISWNYGSNVIVQVSIEDNTDKLGLGSMVFGTEPAPPPPVEPPPVIPPPVSSPGGEEPPPVVPPDTVIPPEIIFVSPSNGQGDVSPDTNIVIQISEGEYPINFETITFTINGEVISVNDPRITVFNNNGKYIFTINPNNNFAPGQTVTVIVNGQDLLGNDFTRTGSFTITTPLETIIRDLLGKDKFPQLKGTIIGDVLNEVGVTGVISGLSLFLLILSLLINSSNIIGTIFGIIAILLNRRKRPWGVILDAKTGKPVTFATCRLILDKTMEVVAQTVSDLDGTYGFAIDEGRYTLEVKHPQYKPFKARIVIEDNEEGYVLDVELVSLKDAGLSRPRFGEKLRSSFLSFYNKFRDIIFVLGFCFAVLSIVISPSIWNWIIFVIFVLIVLINLVLEYKARTRFSDVEDAVTGRKVPFAIVKVYELQEFKNVDTLVCDSKGNFDYFGNPGEYGIIVAAKGYVFPSKKQTDLPLIKDMYSGMFKSKLTRGKNRLRLFLDPDDSIKYSVNDPINPGALQSPFD